ncbi:hypothetical protein [Marivivens marinus]|uniref:hypothetical protein n=1 Tax=Marivivens marinus TaxID=3110173 RepID=UPI003B847EE9
MAGYSGTPLWKKLGLKAGMRATVIGAPDGYHETLLDGAPLVEWLGLGPGIAFVHIFARDRANLETNVQAALSRMDPDGMIWASWPKKASKVPTDITEDVIRDIALPLGLVDVKVCAVDDIWSGLKLVIRKELRSR